MAAFVRNKLMMMMMMMMTCLATILVIASIMAWFVYSAQSS